jgi:hypothetical protein
MPQRPSQLLEHFLLLPPKLLAVLLTLVVPRL